MQTVRESWTDERLDDLRDGMADFRRETKQEFAAVRQDMKEEFAAVRREMNGEFASVRREMKEEFAAARLEMKEGFDGLHRTLFQFQSLLLVALIGLIATQL